MTIDDAMQVKVVLTIGGLSPVIDPSMKVARRISSDITAVYVATDPEQGEKVRRKWDMARHGGTPLVVLPSPYRAVIAPLCRYLDRLHQKNPDTVINLLVPVIVTNEPFDEYLHNGTADLIRRQLRYSEGILVTEIPFCVNMRRNHAAVLAYEPVLDCDDN